MAMIDLLHRFLVPAAYAVLPAEMQSARATAFLLAIALQESGARKRRQVAWGQYLKGWKPGKPRPADWPGNFTAAWDRVAAPLGDRV